MSFPTDFIKGKWQWKKTLWMTDDAPAEELSFRSQLFLWMIGGCGAALSTNGLTSVICGYFPLLVTDLVFFVVCCCHFYCQNYNFHWPIIAVHNKSSVSSAASVHWRRKKKDMGLNGCLWCIFLPELRGLWRWVILESHTSTRRHINMTKQEMTGAGIKGKHSDSPLGFTDESFIEVFFLAVYSPAVPVLHCFSPKSSCAPQTDRNSDSFTVPSRARDHVL